MADQFGHLPRGPRRIFQAARWSWQGLRAAWLHESSFRLEVYLLILLTPIAIWLGQTPVERVLLLGSLLSTATAHGFHAVMARIVGGHDASIRLHAGLGFEIVGTEREVGRKFGRWLDEQYREVLPKSPIAAAITYTRNQWKALLRYTEAGFLSIDNNVSERTVKIAALGRKNWLFVASETGGQRAARLFSLTASCKANCVEPFAYLRDLLTRLPLPGDSPAPERLDELLPDRWLAAHPQHRWWIDDLRRAERRPK